MGAGREIRCFEYVNHGYERVRQALSGDARALFQAATRAASSRAETLAAQLRVEVAGLEVARTIAIEVKGVEDSRRGAGATPVTRLQLEWQAAETPRLFPFMRAELSVYPLTATETQLDLAGRYEPPLGPLGGAIDAIVLHRIAEASVHRFLQDVAGYLRRELKA